MIENKLLKRKQMGNLRRLQLISSSVDFSSNDYLGLARSSQLATSFFQECKTINQFNGLGSTGSRLLTGNSLYAENLEKKIAQFHGYEAGVLFSCGYMANVGLLSAITTEKSIIFYDTQVHASTHDGIRLSRSRPFPFKHNDLSHLENRLKNCFTQGDRFICIESIYSTDGSIAPLKEISQLAKKYEAHLIVDEAHAVGVYGPKGAGLVAEEKLTGEIFAQLVTFGKALGTFGAIILGSHTLKQILINFATSYIYTTALPFQTVAAIKCSYDLFPKMDQEREELQQLIHTFRHSFPKGSMTHIQSIPIKGNEKVKHVAQLLMKEGFDVRALLSPTVRRGHEILRLCLHAFNTNHELTELMNQLQRGLQCIE